MLWCINHYALPASQKNVRRIVFWVSAVCGTCHEGAQQEWWSFKLPGFLPWAVLGSIHQGDGPPSGYQRERIITDGTGLRNDTTSFRGKSARWPEWRSQRIPCVHSLTPFSSLPHRWKLSLPRSEISYYATSCLFLAIRSPSPFSSGQRYNVQETNTGLSHAVSEILSQGGECF